MVNSQTINSAKGKDSIRVSDFLETVEGYKKPVALIAIYDSLLQTPFIKESPFFRFQVQLAKGEAMIRQGDLIQAERLFKNLIVETESWKEPKLLQAKVHYLLGKAYHLNNSLEKASRQYILAVNFYEKLDQEKLAVKALNNIAVIKQEVERFDEAKQYLEQVLDYTKNDEDKTFYYSARANYCYCQKESQEYDVNLRNNSEYYNCLIEVLNEIGEIKTPELIIVKCNLATSLLFLLNQQNYTYISKQFDELQRAIHKNDQKYGYVLSKFYAAYAKLKLYEKNYPKAKAYLNKSESVGVAYGMRDQELINIVKLDYLKKTGQYKQAWATMLNYRTYKDSARKNELKNRLRELDDLYREEKNQSEINIKRIALESREKVLLKKQTNNRLIYFSIIVLLGTVFIIPIYKRDKKRVALFEHEIQKSLDTIDRVKALMEGELKEKLRLGQIIKKDIKPTIARIDTDLKFMQEGIKSNKSAVILGEGVELVFGTREKIDLLINSLGVHDAYGETIVTYSKKVVSENRKLFPGQIILQHYGSPKKFGTKYNTVLFQIINLSLKNAVRHSKGRLIELFLFFHNDRLVIQINDNSKGLGIFKSKTEGSDLQTIFSLVDRIGGNHKVKTSITGTSMFFEFPYHVILR